MWSRTRRRRFAALRERDGDNCCICGDTMDFDAPRTADKIAPGAPTIEHKVPRHQGGSDALDNLGLAHRICNERRGNGGLGQFRCKVGEMA